MAISTAMCTSFKSQLMSALHDFDNPGGNTLTSVSPTTSGTTAYVDFADTTWSSSTITANGALIYNANSSHAAVVTLAFGSDKSSSNGDFTIIFPTANATDAIIRIA